MMFKRFFLLLFVFLYFFISCSKKYSFSDEPESNNIVYSGARSSAYGIHPFPRINIWEKGIKEISGLVDNKSQPSALWIVGVMGHNSTHCRLEFPVDTNMYNNIECLQYDKHEGFLSHFDTTGIKVFLQVESAMANVDDLINIILERYSHHPCVIGFGVDAEWHMYSKENDWGKPIDDESAERWEAIVKSYNTDYKLFLKHWDRKWMPKNYRGDIIFVSDSQQFKNKNHMIHEFADYWGKYFYPNTVFYQIGYPADRKYWSTFKHPIKEWGITIANTHRQNVGIFWVDFTLKDVVKTFSKDGDFIIGTKIYDNTGPLSDLFHDLNTARIYTIIASEKLNANPEFRQLAKEHNMKRFLIFPTFYAPEYLRNHSNQYAIQNNGTIAKDEWVEFACPSNIEFRHFKIDQMKQMIRDYQPDGISIDFIRHFAFWEKIYPDRNVDSLPNTCFCKNCMYKFLDYIGNEIPGDSHEDYYQWIKSNKKNEWIKWKSSLITSMVDEMVSAAKEINPEILVNIHVVPWREKDFENARDFVLGQDIKALAKYADYLSPMTYAHMVKQNPEWISSVVTEMSEKTNCKILPSFQVSKCYLDEEISIDTFREYMRNSWQYPSAGFVFWSWERLTPEEKKLIMLQE